jgi:nucleoside-triphosphatase THEP1
MSKQNIPFFEVNGKRYEIKRNRYLQAEFDAMKSDIEMSDEEQVAFAKEQELDGRIEKLRDRKNELYDKYLETFDEKDEELYKRACAAFDALIDEIGAMESVSAKQRKRMIDMGEKLIIKALQLDNKGERIRTEDEANEIWATFVEEVGQTTTIQFVVFTVNYIIGGDEEVENPFVAQAQAKAEQRANMKKGIAKVR